MGQFQLSVIAAAHCTGLAGSRSALAAAFGDAVIPASVGKTYRFS